MKLLDWKVLGLAAGSFMSFTFVVCVAYDLVFPRYAMYGAWTRLLPGFRWITWWSFLIGIVETFFYGIYFGLVFAPLYNFFLKRFAESET